MAPVLDGAADQLFVGAGAVDGGGAQKIYPEIQCTVESADRFLVVGGTVALRHTHATHGNRRHFYAGVTKDSSFHRMILPGRAFDPRLSDIRPTGADSG